MTKRVLPALLFITLAACFISYKLGSAPTAHAQTTAPAEWSVWATSHSTVNAFATKPAVSGMQHVADCIIADAVNAPGATPTGPIGVKLYDGTSTSGTVLLAIDLAQPSFTVGGGEIHLCGLNLQGTAGRPMQLQIGGFVGTSPYLSVNLVGHDAP